MQVQASSLKEAIHELDRGLGALEGARAVIETALENLPRIDTANEGLRDLLMVVAGEPLDRDTYDFAIGLTHNLAGAAGENVRRALFKKWMSC